MSSLGKPDAPKEKGRPKPPLPFHPETGTNSYMWAMTASPNLEQLISVAPSIWRAKS